MIPGSLQNRFPVIAKLVQHPAHLLLLQVTYHSIVSSLHINDQEFAAGVLDSRLAFVPLCLRFLVSYLRIQRPTHIRAAVILHLIYALLHRFLFNMFCN